jgi:hypothetical protein
LLDLQDSFQIAGAVAAAFDQLQNVLMQRYLQLQFQRALTIQPEFIQDTPAYSVFTFDGALVWQFFSPRV